MATTAIKKPYIHSSQKRLVFWKCSFSFLEMWKMIDFFRREFVMIIYPLCVISFAKIPPAITIVASFDRRTSAQVSNFFVFSFVFETWCIVVIACKAGLQVVVLINDSSSHDSWVCLAKNFFIIIERYQWCHGWPWMKGHDVIDDHEWKPII